MFRLYNDKHKRIKMTPEEIGVTKILKHKTFNDFTFERHVPIGNYIADFVCKDKKIIIDIFYGPYLTVEEMETDKIRLNYFKNSGYKVVRIMDKEIIYDIENVYKRIMTFCDLLPKQETTKTIGVDDNDFQKALENI